MEERTNFFFEKMHKERKENFLKDKEFLENNPEKSHNFTIKKAKSDRKSLEEYIINEKFNPNMINGFFYEYHFGLDEINVYPKGYSHIFKKIKLDKNISLIFDENFDFGFLNISNASKLFKNLNKDDLKNGLNFFQMDLEINNKSIKVDIIFNFKHQNKIEEFKLNPQSNNIYHIPKMNLEIVNI